MSNPACRHQWSVWKTNPGSDSETKWCHVCNTKEERPRARHYQEFQQRTVPAYIRELPACTTCEAKPGQPCLDSNGTPVHVWYHGNRTTRGGTV